MPSIGLCMIVKNEIEVIVRCLDSVRNIVSYVLIEDTGSTDGTQNLVRDWMTSNNMRGMVYDNPWVDFASNRSSALANLRKIDGIDFALVMDADDVFHIDDPYLLTNSLNSLASNAAKIKLRGQGVEYFRIQLVSNRAPFYYRGVLHEFIEGPRGYSVSNLDGCSIKSNREGARSRDPLKYHKDAVLLAKALETEQDEFMISRYTFYLAQSLRDSGQYGDAIHQYLRRASQEFWIEERYCALLYAGRLMEQTPSYTSHEIADVYRRAIELVPNRQEAIHALVRYLRIRGEYTLAHSWAMEGVQLRKPEAGLFLENWIYDFAMNDEAAIVAYWCGEDQKCIELCMRCLESPNVVGDTRTRILKNADFARERLQALLAKFEERKQHLGAD